MKQIWAGPAVQAASKYGEHAPMATACCNVCRTCVTTNLIGVATGAIAAIGIGLMRFAGRFAHSS
jgi:hypothetical protein